MSYVKYLPTSVFAGNPVTGTYLPMYLTCESSVSCS